MNVVQVENNLNYLLGKLINNNLDERKNDYLKIVHKYSMFFVGNRNYIQDYSDKKITINGLLGQLASDIVHTLNLAYGMNNGGAVVVGQVGIELREVQMFISELSQVIYQ